MGLSNKWYDKENKSVTKIYKISYTDVDLNINA